jgi:putative transposase
MCGQKQYPPHTPLRPWRAVCKPQLCQAPAGLGDFHQYDRKRNPKDNPQAERINNTMKNELLKGIVFHNIAEVATAVEKAVDFYNNRRPHMSINNMTPAQAALCSGEIKKLWHSWREDAIKRNSAEKLENPSVIPGNCLPLPSVLGSPSGLRPSVNPRTE